MGNYNYNKLIMKFISVGLLSIFLATSSAIKSAPESVELFATGMDEEAFLDEEITIKGETYHFLQKKNKKHNKKPAGVRMIQEEMNEKPPGFDAVSDEAEKVHVLQTPNGGSRTTYYNKKTQN